MCIIYISQYGSYTLKHIVNVDLINPFRLMSCYLILFTFMLTEGFPKVEQTLQ